MELEEAIQTLKDFAKYGRYYSNNTEHHMKTSINTVLNHLTKQEKLIELMVEYLEDELTDDICNKENCYADEYINGHCQKCLNCIKQYFEKKAEKSE